MASEIRAHPETDPNWPADKWDLLHRTAGSATFQKSNRLREFLIYAGERALQSPDIPLREHEIGVAVFGRAQNYDSSQDTLVRVQASQLRKKLQQYFEDEGKLESCVIELPKGSYSPVFRPRPELEAVGPHEAVVIPPSRERATWWIAGLAVLLAIAAVYLAMENRNLTRRIELGLGSKPGVDRFWLQMFGSQPTHLVLSDANLVVFEDQIQQQISLSDYQAKVFEKLAKARIADPQTMAFALNVMGRPYTGIADAAVARKIGLVAASVGIPLDVVLARDLTISQASAQNTILMGSRRANPWLTLVEEKLNFQTLFLESPKTANFVNRAPREGELEVYKGQWSRLSYCRVAYLANPKSTGSMLLISGTDVPSTEAGGDFVTSESWLKMFRGRLGLKPDAPLPHFEALLQAELVSNTVAEFQLIAWRTY